MRADPAAPGGLERQHPGWDGNDWQAARLFPVAGIGNGEEQERRATSALLAVMSMVREFRGADGVLRCAARRGRDLRRGAVRAGCGGVPPDGVVQVIRGKRTWTALVEVKTSKGRLRAEQIEDYVEIARSRSYDAVITISNELTGGDAEHPVAVDRRKLKKVGLHHLSWDQVRAEAVLVARHQGVADPTQGKVLDEFIRYMSHARSGLGGLVDMGPSWVTVRDAVKAKTARPSDKAVGEVSARFESSCSTSATTCPVSSGSRCRLSRPGGAGPREPRQQLADSGLLFGRLRIPGAVDVVVVGADLRADRATASITAAAPAARRGR